MRDTTLGDKAVLKKAHVDHDDIEREKYYDDVRKELHMEVFKRTTLPQLQKQMDKDQYVFGEWLVAQECAVLLRCAGTEFARHTDRKAAHFPSC